MRAARYWSMALTVALAGGAGAFPPIGRGPADRHEIIPVEVLVSEPPSAGGEISVRARVAPGSFPDASGCPVYAWVVEPSQGGKRRKEHRLKPVGKLEKTRRVREVRPGRWETTEAVRFRLEPRHAGAELRVQVRPSRGGQLDRSATFLISPAEPR